MQTPLTAPAVKASRKVHIDLLRIIAIYFVIYNHTGYSGFKYFVQVPSLREQAPYLIPSVLCTTDVPIFFMISGGLLLGKEESIGEVFRKRILKYAAILVVISLGYWLYADYILQQSRSLWDFLKAVYSSSIGGQLWYLYSYLSILLMLPMLRRMARGMEGKEFLYLAGMSLLFVGILPIVEYTVFQNSVHVHSDLRGVLFTATNIVYFLMGYYFERVMPEKWRNKKVLVGTVVAGAAAVMICVGMMLLCGSREGGLTEGNWGQFLQILIPIPSYSIYLCVKILCEQHPVSPKLGRLLSFVGGTTFGIFLLEPFLSLDTCFIYDFLVLYIPAIPASLIRCLCTLILGIAAVAVFQKIPLLRKLF